MCLWCTNGVPLVRREFLEGLRAITKEDGALLVFDEVMTGFRIASGARRSTGASPPTSRRWARSSGESAHCGTLVYCAVSVGGSDRLFMSDSVC